MSAPTSSTVKTQVKDSPKPLTSAIVSSAIAATQSEYVFELPNAKILSIGAAFQSFSKLRSVDLSFNSLTTLSGIESLPDLRELKANGNKLTAITNLERAKQIEKLVLHDNVITTISGLKDAKFLKHLRLDGNRLRSIDGLDKCFSLLELDVSRNQITSAGTKGLRPLTKLTALNLSYNQLTVLGPDITSLSSLVELDVSHNGLATPTPTTAPGPLAGLHTMLALRILDVSSNALSSLEHVASAAGAQGLVVATPPPASALAAAPPAAAVSAAQDAAASIPAQAAPCPGSPILELYLQRNKFTGCVPASFGATFKRVEILDLSGNALGTPQSGAAAGEDARTVLAGLQGCAALSELDVSGNPFWPSAFDAATLPSLAVLNGVEVGLGSESEGQTAALEETVQEVAQRPVSLPARPGTSSGRPGSARGPPPLLMRGGGATTRPGTASRPTAGGGTLSSSGPYSPDNKTAPARPMSAAARALGLTLGAGAQQGQAEAALDPAAQARAMEEAKECARANLATMRAAMREKINVAMQAMMGAPLPSVAQASSEGPGATGSVATGGGGSASKGANRYLATRKPAAFVSGTFPAVASAGVEASLAPPAFSSSSGTSSSQSTRGDDAAGPTPAADHDVGESVRPAHTWNRQSTGLPAQRQPTRRSAAALVTPASAAVVSAASPAGKEDGQGDGQDSTGTGTAHSSPDRQGDEENRIAGQGESSDHPILRKGAVGSMGLFAVSGLHTAASAARPAGLRTPQDAGSAGLITSSSNSRMAVGPVKASHGAASGAVAGGIKINLGALRVAPTGPVVAPATGLGEVRQAKSATEAAKTSASQRPSSAGRRTGELLAPGASAVARANGGSSSSSSVAKAGFIGGSASSAGLSEQQLSTVLSLIK